MEIEKVLECLNSAFHADPAAIHALIVNRVPCNQEIAEHPMIAVQVNPVVPLTYSVGLIGILNGVLNSLDLPNIQAVFSNEIDGRRVLLGFQIYEPPGEIES